jgi:hypothetical protein
VTWAEGLRALEGPEVRVERAAQLSLLESDGALFFRARAAGWAPAPRYCRPSSAALIDGWQAEALQFLQRLPEGPEGPPSETCARRR